MPEYDYQKYKHLLSAYLSSLGVDWTRGNFRCLNPAHDDGADISEWSMAKYDDSVKCFGCDVNWDIYDLMGARNGITGAGEQYRMVSTWAGNPISEPAKWAPVQATPEFTPDPEAIEEVYQWMKDIRGDYLDRIDAFAKFRGMPAEWGARFAWWPGNDEALRARVSRETLIGAGMIDPEKDVHAWNASGAVVRIARGFKLHYAGRPAHDGRVPTIKRGTRGCHTFPFPALPVAADCGGTIVLCEGEIDAVSGRLVDIPAVSLGGTNGLSKSDAELLVSFGYSRIVVTLDNDAAGQRSLGGVVEKIRSAGFTGSLCAIDWNAHEWADETVGEKDIDDMVKHGKSEVLLKMIEEAKDVEDAETGNAKGSSNLIEGAQGNRREHGCGQTGTQSIHDTERHEGADRGNAGNAKGNSRSAQIGSDAGETRGTVAKGEPEPAVEPYSGTHQGRPNNGGISGGSGSGETRHDEGGVNGRIDNGSRSGGEDVGRGRNSNGAESGERKTEPNRGNTVGIGNVQVSGTVPDGTDRTVLHSDIISIHDEDGVITPLDIPFQFLGFDDSSYYFLPKRQNVPLRVARGQTSMKNQMTELAPMDWWMAFFSRLNKDGEETLDLTSALQWLRDSSTRKGMYNDELLLGTGAYKDTDHIVVNTGSAIVTPDGSVSRFEDYDGRLAFTRAKVELKVDAEPWTVEDGRFFYQQLKTFGFDQPLAYYAVAGWCAIAPFSAFLFRRPHIWITARRGTGKTFLLNDVIAPLIGEDYVFYTDGSTEAGIRQTLRRDNRPVILDEFEANKKYDMDSLDRIIELSRSAYGGKKKVKGSASQTAISFTLKVMFCFASINVNISNDADRSRIAVCRMTESTGKMKSIPNPDGLRARIFQRVNEINANILACHTMMENEGYEYRTADTYSPLLAGLWMILSDRAFPSLEEVDGLSEIDRKLYAHIVASLPQTAQTEEKRPDEERILEEIFQNRLRLEAGNEKTVAEMLTTLDSTSMDHLTYDKEIQRYGMKRGKDRDGIQYLAVVHDNREIKKMLENTPFASSYKEVLKRNPAYMDTRHLRVSEQQLSCIILRWSVIEDRYFKEREEWTDVVPF